MQTTFSPIDFGNTEHAFQAKSPAQLRKAHLLFRMMNNPLLNRIGPKLLSLGFKLGLPIGGIVKSTLFEIFCGGETLEETAKTSLYLNQFGVKTILDYSVEGEKNEAGFDATCQEIIRALQHAGKHEEVAFCACKLTGLADKELLEKFSQGPPQNTEEKQQWTAIKTRIDLICREAVAQKTPIFIDAEESWIQDAIDQLAEEMMERYNQQDAWVYTTAQLYRYDRLAYLQELIGRAKEKGYILGVKLVRGAYLERENRRAAEMGYPTPMQPDKAATDRDFNLALKACIENIDRVHVCAGTHNESSSRYLTKLMEEHHIAPQDKRIVFSQLLGMSDHISFNLSHAGFISAKYLPYGPVKAVMPYLIRRANENTSVAGQSGRELQLLSAELRRRKTSKR